MTLEIGLDLADQLATKARMTGTTVEALALEALRKEVATPAPTTSPKLPYDEFMRLLREVATDCGTSLSDEALSRENISD